MMWSPVVGFEGLYEVSSLGDVRTIKRKGTDSRVLSPSVDARGYRKVCLYRDCARTARWIHRLVLEAFVGPAPEGLLACHNDGNPANNNVANLRWDTREANYRDSVLHGTAAVGERNGQRKLARARRGAAHV